MHFSDGLGLTQDLLPVVTNPMAKRSPSSSIRDLGKVPSEYNARREVRGIKAWTSHRASASDIARWSQEPDYGICVQTRRVRGFDIDVDDPALAGPIASAIESRLGPLPQRYRAGVGRMLLAFRLDGDLPKHAVPVRGGKVEVLGDGNQFVASGVHVKSGTRYEWRNGLPEEVPLISPEQFAQVWKDLVEKFGEGKASVAWAGGPARSDRANLNLADPVLDFLREQGLALRERPDGKVDVECPWADQHTTGVSGDTSTTYLPAGTSGCAYGRFVCLHASHGHRKTWDYLRAIDYCGTAERDLEGLDDEPQAPAIRTGQVAQRPLPVFQPGPNGRVASTLAAVVAALRSPEFCGKRLAYDEFRAQEFVAGVEGEACWSEVSDVDVTRLREYLERVRNFASIKKETARDALEMVAGENRFDSAKDWLNGLAWDGTPRIDRFLEDYFGAAASPYVRAVSAYLWTALAGRTLRPGIKADMVPVAVGAQGTGKSRSIAAIVPFEEMRGEMALDVRDADTGRRLRGKVVVELAELSGMPKRDAESLKAMLSATFDEWIPKYKERALRLPRRAVFFGSSNRDDFLTDETGARRWLPFYAGQCDPDAVARDRDQLWAEAASRFRARGVEYSEAERLARSEHEWFSEVDEWMQPIMDWLDKPVPAPDPRGGSGDWDNMFANPETVTMVLRTHVTGREVIEGAKLKRGDVNRGDEQKVARIMAKLGWKRERSSVSGDRRRRFVRPGAA